MKEVCKFASEAESERIISGLRWMSVLSSKKATITGGNLLDTLCAQLEKIMSFQPGERDLVILQHKFVVEWADGKTASCVLGISLLYIDSSSEIGCLHVYARTTGQSEWIFWHVTLSRYHLRHCGPIVVGRSSSIEHSRRPCSIQ
jgi:Saccharopine dehydrogenase C-terminal domain